MTEERIEIFKRELLKLKGKKISAHSYDGSALAINLDKLELKVNCFFRVINNNKIILSPDYQTDVKLEWLVISKIFTTEYCDYADFSLEFNNGMTLEVISDSSYDEPSWSLGEVVFTPYQIIGSE